MAKLVEKIFTYECKICGARFSHMIQDVAKDAAQSHERARENPPQHKYKAGDFVTARRLTDFLGAKKIIRLGVDRDTHKPAYLIERDQWADQPFIFLREEDIEGLCPKHLLHAFISISLLV